MIEISIFIKKQPLLSFKMLFFHHHGSPSPELGLPSSTGRQGHLWPIHLLIFKWEKYFKDCFKEVDDGDFTAGNLHRTHLPVERVQFEVHRTGQSQRNSNAANIKQKLYTFWNVSGVLNWRWILNTPSRILDVAMGIHLTHGNTLLLGSTENKEVGPYLKSTRPSA